MFSRPDPPEPQPLDERSVTVIHSPQNQFRRAIFVMFIVVGLLLTIVWRQSTENGDKVDAADQRAATAVRQNERLQASLDELIEELRLLEENNRLRNERTTSFIAAVLANSTDPVLRAAAEQALRDLAQSGQVVPMPAPTSPSSFNPSRGPAEPAAAPEPSPTSQPGPRPPADPPSTEEPPPAPPEDEGPLEPVEDAVEAADGVVCGLLPVC